MRKGNQPLPIIVRRKLALETRLAYDFDNHLLRLIDRVGLTNGRVRGKWHHGTLENVELEVSQQASNAVAGLAAVRRACSVDESRLLLEQRLKRLLKHCNVRFGRLKIDVKAGGIEMLHITSSYRPPKDDFSDIFAA
jgi:hypothetical protein